MLGAEVAEDGLDVSKDVLGEPVDGAEARDERWARREVVGLGPEEDVSEGEREEESEKQRDDPP